MPTILTHAVASSALTTAFAPTVVPRRFMVIGAICAMAPDLDVVGFKFGIHYSDMLGHRGLTHSIAFAVIVSFLAWFFLQRAVVGPSRRLLLWLYLFLATSSHGILDAFTNGGLGVAFFAPFNATRYFFPFRPIAVSPIGARFFSEHGAPVLGSEALWVWIPSMTFALIALVSRHLMRRSSLVSLPSR